MESLQRVIIAILVVGVITALGLLALRPVTDLIQFARRRSDRVVAALFGAVIGLFSVPILFLLALRLSDEWAEWAARGPMPFAWLDSEPVFLGAALLFLGTPAIMLALLRARIPED